MKILLIIGVVMMAAALLPLLCVLGAIADMDRNLGSQLDTYEEEVPTKTAGEK